MVSARSDTFPEIEPHSLDLIGSPKAAEEILDSGGLLKRLSQNFKVPHTEGSPTVLDQQLVDTSVPSNVARNLLVPVGTGPTRPVVLWMTMPKCTVDEDC